MRLPARLARLEAIAAPGPLCVFVARSRRARLLGLAGLDPIPADCALLLPRCASVHSFGMRFTLDVTFLGPDGMALRRVVLAPRRLAGCRGAVAVVERRAVGPVSPPAPRA